MGLSTPPRIWATGLRGWMRPCWDQTTEVERSWRWGDGPGLLLPVHGQLAPSSPPAVMLRSHRVTHPPGPGTQTPVTSSTPTSATPARPLPSCLHFPLWSLPHTQAGHRSCWRGQGGQGQGLSQQHLGERPERRGRPWALRPGPAVHPAPARARTALRLSPQAALVVSPGSCEVRVLLATGCHAREAPAPAHHSSLQAWLPFLEPQPRVPGGPHLQSSVPASSSSWGDRQAPAARSSAMTPRCLP